MAKLRCIEELVAAFRETRPMRGGSLIITVYGDAIVPRGGTVWLGSLITLLEPLGLNQRLVRTSVFRLSKEGWLTSQQMGRRSYYSLSDSGRRRFESAFRRIYAPPHLDWDEVWRIVIISQVDAARRETVRRELGWLGYGAIANGVLAHPMADVDSLLTTLQDLGVQDDVIILHATSEGLLPATQPLKQLVRGCWNLEALAQAYQHFLERFRLIWKVLETTPELWEPEQCFQIRILMIHEYRRILLRDPQLPDALLPADWAGTAARLLCRNLYRLTQGPAEQYLRGVLETAEGPLPDPVPHYYRRFGGLLEAHAS
jgi:phenylacetic acid degradation operon negative regulatory protein